METTPTSSSYASNHAHTTGSIAGTIATVGTEGLINENQESYQENLSRIEKICNGPYKSIPLSILYSTSEIIGPDCKDALDTLVESINNDNNLSCWWKVLGNNLNIKPDELKCIELNTNSKLDATKMMLEFYMRYYYATLGEILLALNKIERYDVILKLELPFEIIAQHFDGPEINNEILTITDVIPNGLPESLRQKVPTKLRQNVPTKLRQNVLKRHVKPIILLTFTEDGSTIVKSIKENNKWCIIYTLEDLKNQVIINPRPNIKEYVQMCIELNTNSKLDATKMMLEFYMRYYYATLGEILLALNKIERYDVILKLELPFEIIAQHFDGPEINNEILTITDVIPNGLPESLRQKVPTKLRQNVPTKLRQNVLKRHVKPIILLTFTEDGSTIVKSIKENNKWCIIYTLEDLKNQVIINPRPNIKEYVQMVVDFVVPIVTEGYLTAIESTEETVQKTEPENLDYKYVKFIYDLVMSDSSKLRSVYFCGNCAALYKRITSRREFNIITPVNTFNEQFSAYWKYQLTH